MVRKKLLRAALALTLCVSLVMPVAEVNMQEVMAAEDRLPSVIDAPEEWNGVDDVVIHVDKGAGRYELYSIEKFRFSKGSIYEYVLLSQDAYIYDTNNGTITINGEKFFNEVGKCCGNKGEEIRWQINDAYYISGSIKYTGKPNEQRKPSVIDAPEEWNGVDDIVIHIDKGSGKYELETIKEISFSWSSQDGETVPYPVPIVDAEDITYDADKGEIRIDGKTLFDKIGKYVVTGNGIRYDIDSGFYSQRFYGSFTYTGSACDLHYPAVLGDANERGAKTIEWNGVDDLVIPIDKGTGEYEMVSCHFYGQFMCQTYVWLLSFDSDIYDSSKGGVVINAASLYSLCKMCSGGFRDAVCPLRMDFTLANGEVFRGYELNITVTAKPEADENGLVITDGVLVDYFGEASEITVPETVTTIMPAALVGLEKITINGNDTFVYKDAFFKFPLEASLQELILNGYIGVMGGMNFGGPKTVTVNGMVGNMYGQCSNLIVNGDIAYVYDNGYNHLKDTKIYCKENSNILRYAKENELNYEIIEKQPNEPQIQSANNEFDGTKDLIFKLDNTSDIKEIKNVYLLLSDNVYEDANCLTWVRYYNNGLTNEFEYNPETGEVTLYKELVSKTYGYDYVSIGNTFLGHIVYTAQDGTEKHAFGDWHVKILDKSPDATSPDEMKVNIAEKDVSVSPTNMTYNGKAQEPSVVVKINNETLTYGTDYTLTYRNNTNAGTAEVIVEGKGNYAGSVTKTFAIGKADIAEKDVSVSPTNLTYSGKVQEPSVVVKINNETLTCGTDYTLTYRNNSNAGTAEVIVEGKGNYAGSVTKTFAIGKANQGISGTETYKKAYGDKKFSLDAKSTGDGKLTYSSSDKKVAVVDKNGKVTIKGTGIAVITVKAGAAANYNANTAGMKVTLNVSPARQTIKSIKAAKGKKLTVKWKKDTKATGYQIQCGTDKKFKKGVKTVDIKKNKTTSNTIAKLKKGQKYYVRVRSYKTVKANGKTAKLYGKWSSVKLSANIKK